MAEGGLLFLMDTPVRLAIHSTGEEGMVSPRGVLSVLISCSVWSVASGVIFEKRGHNVHVFGG